MRLAGHEKIPTGPKLTQPLNNQQRSATRSSTLALLLTEFHVVAALERGCKVNDLFLCGVVETLEGQLPDECREDYGPYSLLSTAS